MKKICSATLFVLCALPLTAHALSFDMVVIDDPLGPGSDLWVTTSSSDWNPTWDVSVDIHFYSSTDSNIHYYIEQLGNNNIGVTGSSLTGGITSMNLGVAKNVDRAKVRVRYVVIQTLYIIESTSAYNVDSSSNATLPTLDTWAALILTLIMGGMVAVFMRRRRYA